MEAGFIREIIFDSSLPQGSYLLGLPAIKHLSDAGRLTFSSAVTFFVGENGTGKSTLLEAIAVAFGFNAEGGSRNFNFATASTHSELFEHITLVKSLQRPRDGFFLRAESLYNVATNIEDLDNAPGFSRKIVESFGGVSLHKQSHGESFLSIVQNRFKGNGLYIIDEPEAALSPMRLMTLMAEINSLVKKGSQFIIATHSPILMTLPGAEIMEFSQNGIRNVDYRETEHYQITKRFLDDPDRMLKYLLE
ncbi:MAG: AAA family ATPase [Clostridia bacterium]|nr:AAA family ATPase [Clostridia bacterium]